MHGLREGAGSSWVMTMGGIRLVLGPGAVADLWREATTSEPQEISRMQGLREGLGSRMMTTGGLGLVLGPRGAAARAVDDLNGGVVPKRGSAGSLALGGAEERRETEGLKNGEGEEKGEVQKRETKELIGDPRLDT